MARVIFSGDEDEHRAPLVFLDEVTEQLRAARFVDLDGALENRGLTRGRQRRRDFDAQWIVQQRAGELEHRGRKRGGEKQILTARGQQREDAREFVGEAEVEEPVRLVEHERLDGGELQRVMVDEIEQAAGCGDDDVGPTAQRHHLRIDRYAAEDDLRLELHGQAVAVGADGFADLRSEFARRHEDERAHGPRREARAFAKALQDRQHERRRFAGAGFGRGPDIAAAQHGGNRLQLDWRRRFVVLVRDSAEQRFGKSERRE